MFPGFETVEVFVAGVVIHAVRGGAGRPLLLLHGYPQTHVIWHKIAPALAEHFTVVAADLRGYGDSGKPAGGPDHAGYSKRAMAADQAALMTQLGFEGFCVAGHDRGGRVAHRMALDYPGRVRRLAVLDIAPTHHMYTTADMDFARAYYHWFFLIQPYDLPERLIGAEVDHWLDSKFAQWGRAAQAITPEARAEYRRCFSAPAAIHASCEDYRAFAGIDLQHDAADLNRKLACPVLALWGEQGFVGRKYDVLETWRARAADVRGHGLPCGHFLPEEAPEAVLAALRGFFSEDT